MLIYALYRIGQWIAVSLPVRISYCVAGFVSSVKYFFDVKERVYIADNLKAILGENSPDILRYSRQMYANFGKYLVDFFRTEKVDKEFVERFVKIEGLNNVDEVLKKSKGAIGLTAHLGNWELCGQVIGILGYKISAIALTHKNKRINDFFIRQRALKGLGTISIGAGVKKCFAALKRNEIVGILGDRDFSGENGIFIDFLKRKMLVPRGPAALSLRMEAPIIPIFLVRDENNDCFFKCVFEKPIYPVKTGNDEEDMLVLTQKIARIIEEYVRQYPNQWFMFREFWVAEKVEII